MNWTALTAGVLLAMEAGAFAPQVALPAAPSEALVKSSSPWSSEGGRMIFAPARISLPVRVGGVEYSEAMENSHKGEGLDAVVLYRTPDRQILASVYVYYPSIAHAGLQALATDQAIRHNSKSAVKALGMGVAAAAGEAGVAVTADYSGYLDDLSSKAAFIKAGRWMIKIRVSGPESRSAEVNSAMAALLGDLRFEGEVKPMPSTPIAPAECAAADRRDARLLPDADGLALMGSFLGTFDAAGMISRSVKGKEIRLQPRIGSDWCRSQLDVGNVRLTIVRANDPASATGGFGSKSVLFLLYDDAGGMFEVVRLDEQRRYLVLDHRLAEMRVLGQYDSVPGDAQLRQLFEPSGEPVRLRARVTHKTDGNSNIELAMPDEKKKRRAK